MLPVRCVLRSVRSSAGPAKGSACADAGSTTTQTRRMWMRQALDPVTEKRRMAEREADPTGDAAE